ncbi:MAG: hypothetical protein ABFQ89_06515, partial [Chloroflexota bacterium]
AVYEDQNQVMPLAFDHEAIKWLERNVEGSPVILEANTYPKLYGWGSRYSINTGLPTVAGWEWHSRQHRAAFQGSVELVRNRIEDIQTIYETTDIHLALDLLHHYQVEFIIYGPLERAYYDNIGEGKFAQMISHGYLEEVYQNPGVSIFRTVHN